MRLSWVECVVFLTCVRLTVLSGTGTGIVSIVLSALKAALLGETLREGRLFATDLGRYPAPLLYI